jgi:hypothetical protein
LELISHRHALSNMRIPCTPRGVLSSTDLIDRLVAEQALRSQVVLTSLLALRKEEQEISALLAFSVHRRS